MAKQAKTIRIDEDIISYINAHFNNLSSGAIQLMKDGITYRNSLTANNNDQVLVQNLIREAIADERTINEHRLSKVIEKVSLETTAIMLLLQELYINQNESVNSADFEEYFEQLMKESESVVKDLRSVDRLIEDKVDDYLNA